MITAQELFLVSMMVYPLYTCSCKFHVYLGWNFINIEFMPPISKNGILNPAYRIFKKTFYILDEPLDDRKWNLLCLSIDGNNYLRFNLNGETLLAQKIKNSARKYFSKISTITFGSELVSGLLELF